MGQKALSDYAVFDPAVLESPWEFNRRLREEAPVYRDPATGMYLVSTYAGVAEVLRNHEIYSSRFAAAMGGSGTVSEGMKKIAKEGWPPVDTMLTADPPEQKRFRGLVAKAFSGRRVERIAPRVEVISEQLVDAFISGSRVELVSAYCVPLPLTVIAEQLGVPAEDLPRFKRWSDGFVAQLGQMADAAGELEAAKRILEYQHYFAKMLEARRAEPQPDMISDLVHAEVEGERPLDTAESLSIIQQLLVAGNETTASTIAEGMLLLARHPEQLERVRADLGLVPNLVEEVTRLTTPTANMWRVVTRDTVLGAVEIPKGAFVIVRFASANRDESVFPDPDRFDIGRPNAPDHLAFGQGVHFCVGAMLARKEMAVAFRDLITRLDSWAVADEDAICHKPNVLLRGLGSLPLDFVAAA